MEFVNELSADDSKINKISLRTLMLLLAPIAPHLAEELWEKTGHKSSIFLEKWPKYEEKYLKSAKVNLVVQVDGRTRGTFAIPANAKKEEIEKAALDLANVKKHLEGKVVDKIIVIANRLVNIVTLK
jgi:leucyl-tRNA synthetase